ncbi:MAG: HAD hydrolase family protein, partial [Lachnospiraceae bacterium]
ALASPLGVQPEECMTFADRYNDVEMLEYAGVSYAMADGAPGLSAYSTDITNSVEDVLEGLLS